jgi:hypothetical protein
MEAEKRQAHLIESKALLDKVMSEANLTSGGRGIDRVSEMADNLTNLPASRALNVANARLGEFAEELNKSGMTKDAVEAETEVYKSAILNYLRQVMREKL